MKKIVGILAIILLLASCGGLNEEEVLSVEIGDSLTLDLKAIEFVESYPTVDVSDNEIVMLVKTEITNTSDQLTDDGHLKAVAEVEGEQYESEPIYADPSGSPYLISDISMMNYILAYKIPKMEDIKKVTVAFFNNQTGVEYGKILKKIDDFQLTDPKPTSESQDGVLIGKYRDVIVKASNPRFISYEEAKEMNTELVTDMFRTDYMLLHLEVENDTDTELGDYFYTLASNDAFDSDSLVFNGAGAVTYMLQEFPITDNIFEEGVIPPHSVKKGDVLFEFHHMNEINFDDLYLYVQPFYGDQERIKLKIEM